jgi:hypothetical protein
MKALGINTSTTPGLSFLDSPFFLSLEKDTEIIKISYKSERAQKANILVMMSLNILASLDSMVKKLNLF